MLKKSTGATEKINHEPLKRSALIDARSTGYWNDTESNSTMTTTDPSIRDGENWVWIDRQSTLPNICCDCGAYTDHRVKLKQKFKTRNLVAKSSSEGWFSRMILHLLLGPIAIVFDMLGNPDKDDLENSEIQEKTESITVKIPQCVICAAQAQPRAVDCDPLKQRVLISVHPKLASRIAESTKSVE